MRNFKLLLVFVAVFATLQASALSRDCNLTVKVVAATGESLEGQRVMLVQTDYSMTYGASETTLDAAGECRLKVYSGNHRLTVERAGYAAYAKDFPVTGDMTLNVTLTEDVRNPFALKLAERHDPMTGKNDVTLQWNREDPVFSMISRAIRRLTRSFRRGRASTATMLPPLRFRALILTAARCSMRR